MRIARVLPALLMVSLLTSLSYAAQDRIAGAIDSSQVVALKGNMHGLARPEYDQGRADGSRMLHAVSLSFRPSAAQQKDLDQLLATLQNPSSPNYHKFLTPAQFGSRFGLSQTDINKIVAWLQAEGFHNISVANGHNEISFDGTVAQVEMTFHTEMHNYLVNDEIHMANATEPSVPAALGGAVVAIGHLHDFAPKPRAKVRPNFTSFVSGNHFLSPADFATIYDVQALYTAGSDGTGQKIAIVGQSSINLSDISNFRSAAGLSANPPTQITIPNSTAMRCSGDEGESDLDLEWSGGVAKNATIIFVIAGLSPGAVCGSSRSGLNVWNALDYAVQNDVAPFISSSYGYCEAGLGSTFALQLQSLAQQGQAQGQTIVASSGDAGAADCDGSVTSATQGLAVDLPAAVPEVTGAGGNEFSADSQTNTPPGADPPYWAAAGASTDTLSSALEYIPEQGWNDTTADIAAGGGLAASGGGSSTFFAKPAWQTGAGFPAGNRAVPDISLSASANHDGYLFCSEDGPNNTIVATCTAGFRTGAGGNLTVVGGTSAVSPTFSALMALLNQYLGNVPPTGLAPLNPKLYSLAASTPAAFHDVTAGSNIVPCTSGSPNCPSVAPFQFGFSAGVGYDQVTGLGSVDAFALAQAWSASRTATTTTVTPSATNVNQGTSVTFSATVTPTATGNVSFFNNGSTTALGTSTVSAGVATFTTTTLPIGTNSVTAKFNGNTTNGASTSAVPAVVTVTAVDFSIATNPTSGTMVAGHTTTSIAVIVSSINGFTGNVVLSCPATTGVTACNFNPTSVNPTSAMPANASLTITTAANAPSSISVPVTGTSTSPSLTHAATFALTVTTTDQGFTLAPTANTYPVTQGGSITANLTLTPSNGFSTTSTPVTYTCTDPASESQCVGPNGPTTTLSPSFQISTTPPTARLEQPLGRGAKIFYAAMLPGLLGILFTAGSRKRSLRGMRLLGLIVVLGFSTLWLGSCGGSSGSNKNPGTPPGSYAVTVNATTGGSNPVTATTTINLQVNP